MTEAEIVIPEAAEVPFVDSLSRDEARALTDEAKRDTQRLWMKLLELYEGGAHVALGYSSWGAYFKAEFDGSKTVAYRILDSGRVARALEPQSPMGDSPMPNERQARELTPLKDDPEAVRAAWSEALEEGPKPTATDVRRIVQRISVPVEQTTADCEAQTASSAGASAGDADALVLLGLIEEMSGAVVRYRGRAAVAELTLVMREGLRAGVGCLVAELHALELALLERTT